MKRPTRKHRMKADTKKIEMSPVNAVRTIANRQTILVALSMGLSRQGACDEAGIARSSFYKWCREDAEFRQDVEDAYEGGTDMMEDEAMRRGVKGWLKPVYQQGELVGHVREYDGNMLRSQLASRRKSWRPGPAEAAIADEHDAPVETLTRDQLISKIRELGLQNVIPSSFRDITPEKS